MFPSKVYSPLNVSLMFLHKKQPNYFQKRPGELWPISSVEGENPTSAALAEVILGVFLPSKGHILDFFEARGGSTLW